MAKYIVTREFSQESMTPPRKTIGFRKDQVVEGTEVTYD